jgi:TetR/AcrR family transcriptional regulator, cholesterol catabolism regulator
MMRAQAVRKAVEAPEHGPGRGYRSGRGDRTVRRKLEILRGAAAAFRDRGYAASSVRDIARRLGMAPGNLYYYFRNKQEILYFCQDYSLDVLLREARRIDGGAAAPEEKVRDLIRAQVRCMLDELDGSAGHIEFHAMPRARLRKIIAKRDAYERIVRGVVLAGARSGEFRTVDAKLATLAILGALNATVTWWRPEGPLAPTAIADAFSDTLVRGLLP